METVVVRDENFHDVDGVPFPRVTWILDVGYPKGYAFQQWLKQNGNDADDIRDRAADSGSLVHELISELLKGGQLFFGMAHQLSDGRTLYVRENEWKKLIAFCAWYNEFQPDEVLHNEIFLYSKKHTYSGTADFIVKKDGRTLLLDFKTGKQMHTHFWAQLAAYAFAYHEMGHGTIDEIGVIHLGTKHKKGYDYQVRQDVDECYKLFEAAHLIFRWEKTGEPDELPEPSVHAYPGNLRLEPFAVGQKDKTTEKKVKKIKLKTK